MNAMAEPAPLQVRIERLPSAPAATARHLEWDAYVTAHEHGSFFHLSGWQRAIEQAFGHRMIMLYARVDEQIVGVLPLGYIRSLIFGKSLISNPFCVLGGPLADTVQVRQQLEAEARRLAEQLEVGYIEYRSREPIDANRPTKDLYVSFRKTISDDHDENLKSIPRKQRAVVRKGTKAGLVSRQDRNAAVLWSIYSESVRNLGTPVFPRRWFETLLNVFEGQVDIVTVTTAEGEPVASTLNFYFRDEVLPYYGGGRASARHLYANDFLYWEVMRRAVDAGYRVFDYGRSKQGTGSYRFKKHWGFEPEPLYYEYDLVRADEMPNISPVNPKFEKLVKIWQRLPLPVSRAVGPWIARDLA